MRDKSIQIPKELFDKLKTLGQKSNRTISKEISYLLDYFYVNETAQEYCEREPMRTRILEALEEKDKISGMDALLHIEEEQKRKNRWLSKKERKRKK
ncbi:MAG: hypothetical protein IJA14_03855 [Alphaproteobacteria bacterium]|nr:hypothetical protein [Alphaproteobacteria bacterium]